MKENIKIYHLIVLLFLLSPSLLHAKEQLVFSSPPREPISKGIKTYEPIAKFLSTVLGKNIVYEHPGNWPTYSAKMRRGYYDIVFDGPHFASWRMKFIEHKPVLKIPGDFIFVFATTKNNKEINNQADLIAKKVCGYPPPNLGTLMLFSQFTNPVRQPTNVTIRGFKNIYAALLEGKCEAAVLPLKIYNKIDPDKSKTRVVFTSRPVPNQAITLGPKFTDRDALRIRTALLSNEGKAATRNLRKRFAASNLTKATSDEYRSAYKLLQYSYGFDVY